MTRASEWVRALHPTRLIERTRVPSGDPARVLRHFLVAFYLHTGLRILQLSLPGGLSPGVGAALLAAAVVTFAEREVRFGPLLALPAFALFAWGKPVLGNHGSLEVLLSAAVVLAIPLSRERSALAGDLIRWLCVLTLLGSGVQKVLYGTYFRGSMLALMASQERFQWLWELVLPAWDYERLMASPEGPFVFESWIGIAAANGVYLAEIGSALLLLSSRTRPFGLALAFLTILGIELGAREVGFGVTMVLMLLLYLPSLPSHRAFPLLPLACHAVFASVNAWWPRTLFL